MYSLSACLIAKDEEKNIEKCLISLLPIAGEIIVVDTGSTDATCEVASQYGATVIHTTWENDFSKARNLSLKHATKDWLLIIDCDEAIPESQLPTLRALLDTDCPHYAIQFQIHNIVQGTLTSSAIVLRLIKNHEDFHFTSPMHEQISPSILAKYGQGAIGISSFYLEHFGYDDAVSSQSAKSQRNLSLLLGYDEADKNGYYYFVLGNEYSRIKAYKDAIQCYEKSLSAAKNSTHLEVYYPYALINLAGLYNVLGFYTKAYSLTCEGETIFPHFKDLYMLQALITHNLGHFARTDHYLTLYAACTDAPLYYPSHQYDTVSIANIRASYQGLIGTPCLYSCLFVTKATPTLLSLVKNLNNISHKLFVFIKNEDLDALEPTLASLQNYGATIFNLGSHAPQAFLDPIIDEVKNQWILLLKDDEFLSLPALNLLSQLTTTTAIPSYRFTFLNQQTYAEIIEPRLFHIQLHQLLAPTPLPTLTTVIAYKDYTL